VTVEWHVIGDRTGHDYGTADTKTPGWETEAPNCEPVYQACDRTIALDKEYGPTTDVGQPHDWTAWTDNGDGTLSRVGIQDTETPWIQRYVDARDKETPCGGERGVDKGSRRVKQTKDKGDPTFSVNMVCDRQAGGDVYQAIILFTLGDGARGITVDGKSFDSSGHKYVGFGSYGYTIHGDAQYNDASGSVKVTHQDCLDDITTVDLGGPIDPLAGAAGGLAVLALLGAGALVLRKRIA